MRCAWAMLGAWGPQAAAVLVAAAMVACGSRPEAPAETGSGASAAAAAVEGPLPAPSAEDRAAAAEPEAELPELPPKPARALPEGVFVGTAREIPGSRIEIVVRAGAVTEARYAGPTADEAPIALSDRGRGDADALTLTGRNERDYVQLRGSFVDAERIRGTYRGGLASKVVEGEWYAVRR
ncbi:MAG: hypothetical protein H6744_11485 [Deltaproteobacteria bacterium]|nr:hypothetical protein [Deltaproteobacteria bacterium]MCB9787298.1 hypothetical protein [Deltaproteobacteria bacterium]